MILDGRPLIDVGVRVLVLVVALVLAVVVIARVVLIVDLLVLVAIEDLWLRGHHGRMLLDHAPADSPVPAHVIATSTRRGLMVETV